MYKCNIQSIKNDSFTDLTKLRVLFLDDNNFKRIDAKTFNGLECLIDISIKNCQIESIGKDSFINLKNLNFVSIGAQNKLKNDELKCLISIYPLINFNI